MKTIRATIHSISVHSNQIEVSLSGRKYTHIADIADVNWFPADKNGNSVKGTLSVGTEIEFDGDINPKTRSLKNVSIIL